ncbi:MAG: FAD-binding protein, partial [Desulfovibrionales bacterium]
MPDARFDAVVLGAGASGLMTALTAAVRGRKVAVLDHMD